MKQYLIVLALSAMPAIGSAIGGFFAESLPQSHRYLSVALHAAAGIALSVVGVELMPQILQADPPWLTILAFVAGGGFFILMRKSIKWLQKQMGTSQNQAAPWLIFLGVGVDLFSDGLMVATGSTITFGLGLILALGQVMANIPGGLATLVTFKQNKTSPKMRQILSGCFFLPALFGASLGYWAVRGKPQLLKFTLLSFTAGILTTVVVENMVPEASEKEKETYQETLSFVGGFALFALLSIYLG